MNLLTAISDSEWASLYEDILYYVMVFIQVLLLGGIGFLRKKAKKQEKAQNYNAKETIRIIQDGQKEANKDIYKLQICNKELPLDERLKAYDKYKALGGNSYIDKYVKENLKND